MSLKNKTISRGEIYKIPAARAPMTANKTGSWRYLTPSVNIKTPPCEAACPLSVPVSDLIQLVERGNIDRAMAALLDENPLPGVCGRICVHPCEDSCSRGQFDGSLAIHMLERYAADNSGPVAIKIAGATGKSIAIIGAGPAGLSAAYFLQRLGHAVTIFEASDEPGGILRYGIPEYRMPGAELAGALKNILSLKPVLKTGMELGKNLSFSDLGSFDSIFLACGAHIGRNNGILPEKRKEIISGIELLKLIKNKNYDKIGKRVVIIGGGNTAVDAARSLLRIGRKPLILYRRDIEDMPAFKKEIREALREGIEIETLSVLKDISLENGSIIGVSCIKVNIEGSRKTGNEIFREIPDSQFIIEADSVVAATGELPDLSFLPSGMTIKNGKVLTDKFSRTNIPGIFAGGDLVNQPHLVVHALASGKRTAVAIDTALNGIDMGSAFRTISTAGGGLSFKEYLRIRPSLLRGKYPGSALPQRICRAEEINQTYFGHIERTREKKLPLSDRISTFSEVHTGYSSNSAERESRRCYHCGRCVLCGSCMIFCPDISIRANKKNNHVIIDYDYCKGCGLCAVECPRGVIEMEREEAG